MNTPAFPLPLVRRFLSALPDRLKAPVEALTDYSEKATEALERAVSAAQRVPVLEAEIDKLNAALQAPLTSLKPIAYLATGSNEQSVLAFNLAIAETMAGAECTTEALYSAQAVRAMLRAVRAEYQAEIQALVTTADQQYEEATALLAATALALKGPAAPGTAHRWDDLPTVAAAHRAGVWHVQFKD